MVEERRRRRNEKVFLLTSPSLRKTMSHLQRSKSRRFLMRLEFGMGKKTCHCKLILSAISSYLTSCKAVTLQGELDTLIGL